MYGKGVQLVVPTASFVLKTRDKKSGEKVFINVCTSDKVRGVLRVGRALSGLEWLGARGKRAEAKRADVVSMGQ